MNKKTKKLWQLVAVLTVNLLMLILISAFSADAMCLGNSGERVAEIKQKLSQLGFSYNNSDGIYDFEMRKAITDFQSEKGMEATGEADYDTLRALGIDSHCSECFSARAEILARCIQQSGCKSYPEMLYAAERILATASGASTLGKYVAQHMEILNAKPSDNAYAAAINTLRK